MARSQPHRPDYTPYAGPAGPFSIGLRPLDLDDWIEPDDLLDPMLAEKRQLFADRHEDVVRALPESLPGQRETLELLVDYLPRRYAKLYRRDGGTMVVLPAERREPLDAACPPIEIAARLVQDDLVLMRPGPEGYVIAAAAVCFPSSWSLATKFGKPMMAVHSPVPGWADGMGARVDRIMANLKVDQPVWRTNWSIYPDDRLRHSGIAEEVRRWSGDDVEQAALMFVRVERQTLRRLPQSGDILFTIRVHLDPLRCFEALDDGAELARHLAEQLRKLDAEQLAYKGLSAARDGVVAWLERHFDADVPVVAGRS